MAVLEELNVLDLVRQRVSERCTHKTIAEELGRLFPGVRGIGRASVKRFCAKHKLHRTSRLPNEAVDVLVAYGLGKVSADSINILHKDVCVGS